MAVNPNGGVCLIREQIIEDIVSGLTFQFIHKPDFDAPFRLHIFGPIPHGNREILFDANGVEAGVVAGTGTLTDRFLKEVKS